MEKHIERAIGSSEVPLTDAQIDHKFKVQSAFVIGEAATEKLLQLAWRSAELDDIADVARCASEHTVLA